MQQHCQYCGYESSTIDRFCRQCGGSLLNESEVTTATTRNYARQEFAGPAASVSSGQLPPSVGDVLAGETERYYRAPPAPIPSSPVTAPIGSKIKHWRWVMLLFVLIFVALLSTAITVSIVSHPDRPLSPEEARNQAQEDERRRQEDLKRELEDHAREAQDRAREAQEAVERAREAAEEASKAAASMQTDQKLLDLTQYEYPKATVTNLIRIPGNEVMTVLTSDSFDAVNEFYQKKLGKPVIQINESPEERKLLFQSNTTPSIAVSVESDDEHPGQLKIVVIRSPFPPPKPAIAEGEK